MKLYKLLSISIILLLTGCGVVQQRQAQSELQAAISYCKSLDLSSELDVIRDKIPLDDALNPTFEMLTLNSKPSEQEKLAIKRFVELRTSCRARLSDVLVRRGTQNQKIIFDSYNAIGDGQMADFYNGQLTYSELNKLRQKNAIEFTAAMANEDEKIMSRNALAAQQAYQNYMIYQQTQNQNRMINSINKPITCNKVGNFTTCN